jgi:hypothetical protein
VAEDHGELFVVVQEAEDVESIETLAAFEKVKLDGEGKTGDFTAELLNELDCRFHGAAGGEKIIDEDDTLATLDGVEMDFKAIGAVLEIIGDTGDGRGQLARLANGNEAGVEPIGQRGAEDESAGLNAENEIDFALKIMRGQSVNELREAGLVFEQRGDVVKEDAGLGKIGDGADKGLKGLYVDGVRWVGHDASAAPEQMYGRD